MLRDGQPHRVDPKRFRYEDSAIYPIFGYSFSPDRISPVRGVATRRQQLLKGRERKVGSLRHHTLLKVSSAADVRLLKGDKGKSWSVNWGEMEEVMDKLQGTKVGELAKTYIGKRVKTADTSPDKVLDEQGTIVDYDRDPNYGKPPPEGRRPDQYTAANKKWLRAKPKFKVVWDNKGTGIMGGYSDGYYTLSEVKQLLHAQESYFSGDTSGGPTDRFYRKQLGRASALRRKRG
jgi:hypothetical protein